MPHMLSPVFRLLPSKNQVPIPSPLAIGLGVLGFVSLCSRVNSYLSRRALNGVTATPTWDSEQEIVVVTGGSSGIGAALVELLAQKGIKTLILDVAEPREDLSMKITKPPVPIWQVTAINNDRIRDILLQSRPRQP